MKHVYFLKCLEKDVVKALTEEFCGELLEKAVPPIMNSHFYMCSFENPQNAILFANFSRKYHTDNPLMRQAIRKIYKSRKNGK